MLRFGGPEANLGSVNVVGNIGVRYVQTDISSHGFVGFPNSQWYTQALASGQGACNPADNGANQATDVQCWLTPELLAYSNGAGTANTLDKSYENWLPSLNVRWLHRQAVRALRLFEVDLASGLRPPAQLGGHQSSAHRHQQYLAVSRQECAGPGDWLQLRVQRRSRLRGPRARRSRQLRPVLRDVLRQEQLFHVGLFYKQLSNAIAYGAPTATSRTTAPPDSHDPRPEQRPEQRRHAQGPRTAFQTFFDSLPGAWSGLGVQLNFTTPTRWHQQLNLAVQAICPAPRPSAVATTPPPAAGVMPAIRSPSPAT